jgi:sulfopropanediol 3-dehydrogenase
VRDTVAKIIEAIDARGDDALREYSTKFANWEPLSFQSESDIDACFAQMSKSDIDDIRFAQAASVSA